MASAASEVYAVKRVQFLGKPVSYICQNINGPCPLLAIGNVLLLRGHIVIDEHVNEGVIAASDLIQVVMKRLVDANPPLPESDELGRLTQQKTLEDVKQLMPSLLVGLDVNVRFHSITDFEYTVACAVFDMLDIALVHGWLLDIQDEKTLEVVQNKSYNELIERVVDYRAVMMTETARQEDLTDQSTSGVDTQPADASAFDEESLIRELAPLAITHVDMTGDAPGSPAAQPPKSPSKKTVEALKRERKLSEADATDTATALLEEGPVLEEFFASSASQLTYYGLVKLHEDIRERQLSVFFRNNHFSTLFKNDGALYLLVTDAGYLDEPNVVWERLNEIDGDSDYLDENFRPLNASETRQQTILTQQEEVRRRQLEGAVESQNSENTDEDRTTSQGDVSVSNDDPDFLLALKLQKEEEDARAQAVAQRAASAERASHHQAAIQDQSNSEGYDSRTPSQGPSANSESEAFAVNANGELVLSEAELQAQREAAFYYQQQRMQQQTGYPPQYQAPASGYQPNRAAPPASNRSTSPRRQPSECVVM